MLMTYNQIVSSVVFRKFKFCRLAAGSYTAMSSEFASAFIPRIRCMFISRLVHHLVRAT